MKKNFFACIIAVSIGILSSFSALADDEIRFKLSAEKPENNTAEVILVCDRNPGISECEFNIMYNSSIISLGGYEFKCEGFTTEEINEEGRINVKFKKSDNDLSAGGKVCSLLFNINNSNEKLAGVTLEFVSLKDNGGNELNRLVESCDITIPDGIEPITQDNSSDDNFNANSTNISDNENETTENTSASSLSNDNDKEALSNSVEDENDTVEIILLILGGIMIVGGAVVLYFNLKSKKGK